MPFDVVIASKHAAQLDIIISQHAPNPVQHSIDYAQPDSVELCHVLFTPASAAQAPQVRVGKHSCLF